MEINGIPFDKATACHNIALAYATEVLKCRIADGEDPENQLQDHLDLMYELYLESFGHLSGKDDRWVSLLLHKF